MVAGFGFRVGLDARLAWGYKGGMTHSGTARPPRERSEPEFRRHAMPSLAARRVLRITIPLVVAACIDATPLEGPITFESPDAANTAPFILEWRVAAGTDDAEESPSGSMYLNSSDLELVRDGKKDQTVGIRFSAVTIPPGATITNAFVQFQVDETGNTTTALTIRGEATGDAAPFASATGDLSTRSTTASAVAWAPAAWNTVGEAGTDQRTPDLAAVIQEIVDGPGWASGNAMAIIITGTGKRTAEAWEGDASGAPLLHVEFTLESNVPPTASFIMRCTDFTCTFTNTSSDFDGSIATSAWTFGDGTTSSETSPSHTYATAGSYTIALTVTDDAGAAATSSQSVTLPNAPPSASFTVTCIGLVCTFTNTSSDADGGIAASAWELGDGNASNATSPSHSYAAAGTYTVQLTVTDDLGTSGSTSQDVTVSSPPDGGAVLVGAGDIAVCDASGDEATALLLDGIPGTVFTAGDNVYPDGTAAEFTNCFDPSWGRYRARTRPAPGNHDYHTPGAAGYFDYFGAAAGDPTQGYYSYDLGGWHILSLNSNISMSAGSAQEQWLRADLAASAAQCTLAYWHHPRFSSGPHGNLTSITPLWQALYDYGAEVVVVGHDHDYERFAPQTPEGALDVEHGIRQFVAGTGGASRYPIIAPQPNSEVADGDTHGVLKLTLYPGSYTWEFVPVAGGTFVDAGAGSCHGPRSTPGNLPPAAGFTATCPDLSCVFTNTSTDPDGSIVTSAWDFGDNTSSNETSPSHDYVAGGTYTVALTVTDDGGAVSSTSQVVTVGTNELPTATFDATCSGLRCVFTDLSSDPDGTIVSWAWAFGDGAEASTMSPSHDYGADGTYTVTLTVTDNRGASDVTAQSVAVVNLPPTAGFTASCSSLTCQFTDGSSDADGSVTAWSWTFGDGETALERNPTHTYPATGTYTVALLVSDNAGATGTSSQTVAVAKANDPPAAAFAVSCDGLTCQFTDGSSDPDGTVVLWSWTFGDGAVGTGAAPSHSYAASGAYTVALAVTDDSGAVNSTSQIVTVVAPISLTASAGRVKGVHTIQLSWSGATSASVDLFRNTVRMTVPNTGTYTDSTGNKGGGQVYVYRVCEAGTTTCSDPVTVSY